ncbi:DUF998 domain-containing protein [Micromonospora chalcea]
MASPQSGPRLLPAFCQGGRARSRAPVEPGPSRGRGESGSRARSGGLPWPGACRTELGRGHRGCRARAAGGGLSSRFLLALGGLATVALIAFPRPQVGGSPAHGVTATVAVLALSLWPAGSALRLPRRVPRAVAASPAGRPPWAFRRPVALAATAVLLALFGWSVVEVTGGSRTGLAERVAALAVTLWPLAAVLSARRAHRHWTARPPRPDGPPVSPGRREAGA